ncbi:MAG: hypothetical protein MUE49_13155 [Rhodospirillales bacterium]|nr:hypothetical protein [Rhodospirillales bacterium]
MHGGAGRQAAARAVDASKWCFDVGCHLLGLYGEAPRPARAIVARWLRRAVSPEALLTILVRAGKAERGDLRAYVERALAPEGEPAAAQAVAADPVAADPDAALLYRAAALRRINMSHLLSPDEERRLARLEG